MKQLKTGDIAGYLVLTTEGETMYDEKLMVDVVTRKRARELKNEYEAASGFKYRIARVIFDK